MKLQKIINGIEFYAESAHVVSTKDQGLTLFSDENNEYTYFIFKIISENSVKKYLHVAEGQKIKHLLIWNMGEESCNYDLTSVDLSNLNLLRINARKKDELIIDAKQNVDNLKGLSIRQETPASFIELPFLEKIRHLTIDAEDSDAIDLIGKCNKINDCFVYSLKANDLSAFSNHGNLKRLRVSEGSIKALDGLSKLENLETLHVVATKSLKHVDDMLLAKNLKNIMFSKYRKITNWDFLTKKDNWNAIWLEVAKNIDFIKSLPNTKYFFCNKVLDKKKDNDKLFRLENGASLFSFFYGDLLK